MTSKTKQTAFRLESEILDGMKVVKDRDGVPISNQVRLALRAWLKSKRVNVKAASRRGAPRRKA